MTTWQDRWLARKFTDKLLRELDIVDEDGCGPVSDVMPILEDLIREARETKEQC